MLTLSKLFHHSLSDQQTVMNNESIGSLILQIEGLVESFSAPAPESKIKEI